ncbi:MarR family winged helix-turn-helix transcriptional regulator [Marinitoga litoralis]|uniref:MarR family winged helix-turn-helix transcriptional regulator n=1 Tax=Marinitoga litoralis TaxID=570855 RepID=UPI001960426E|nr:MarR family transcriptional regulator [Marinitoga litoralis]MBM7560233.1 DNA-binding MarR family transcriptional regulator [Marinitoga litoralis]
MNKTYEVMYLFKEIRELVKKSMVMSFEDSEITSSQWMLLGALLKNGKMTMSELSNYIGLSNSTVSGIVDRLEKHDYIRRVRDDEDRRKVYVEITEKFNEVAKKSHKKIEKQLGERLNKVSDKELNTVIEGLKILKKIFEEE